MVETITTNLGGPAGCGDPLLAGVHLGVLIVALAVFSGWFIARLQHCAR